MTFVSLKSVMASAALAAVSIAPAQADVLIAYDFGVSGAETLATTANVSGVSGSTITGGAGLTTGGFVTANLGFATQPVLQVVPNGFTTPGEAIAGDSYFEFTVNPGTETLDLDSLTFDGARGGGSSPRGYDLRSSLDNFATSLGFDGLPTVRPDLTTVVIDLDNIAIGGDTDAFSAIDAPLQFRVFVFSPNSNNSLEFDNIALNGVVVPEPASLALISLGGICCLARRRRRVA